MQRRESNRKIQIPVPGDMVFLFEANGDSGATCRCAEILGCQSLPLLQTYSVMLDDSTVEHGIVRESICMPLPGVMLS